MKIENFCNLGAALQTQTSESLKQPQVYFYRSTEDTISEMLEEGYFDALERRVQKNDFMILYHPMDGENKRQFIYTKVLSNNGGKVSIEPCQISAEEIFVDPSWSHLLPDPIDAENLKDYLDALETHLNTNVVHNWEGADESVDGEKTWNDDAHFGGEIDVAGDTTLNEDLEVKGNINFSSTDKTFTVKPTTQIDGDMTSTGDNSFTGDNDFTGTTTAPIGDDTEAYNDREVATKGWVNDPTKATFVAHRPDIERLQSEIDDVASKTLSFIGYIGTTDPSTLSLTLMEGNLWINSATMPTTFPISASSIKVWTDGAWVNATEGFTPNPFDTFRFITDGEGYYWFGGEWKTLSTDMSATYFSLNTSTGKWEIKDDVNLPGAPTATTPAVSDNTTKIITSEWFNTKVVLVQALPAIPDEDVIYLIEEPQP